MSGRAADSLEFNIVISPSVSAKDLAVVVAEHLLAVPGFAAKKWRFTEDLRTAKTFGDAERKGKPKADDLISAGEEKLKLGFSVFGASASLDVLPIDGAVDDGANTTFGKDRGWRLTGVDDGFEDDEPDAYAASLSTVTSLLRAAVKHLPVSDAAIRRESESVIAPAPPHCGPDWVAAVVSAADIERDYSDAKAYFAGWDRAEYFGTGRVLLESGMSIFDETEFKLMAAERAITLARIAKPGRTDYAPPFLFAEEDDAFAEQERLLHQAGFIPGPNILEFGADIGEDGALSPADLFELMSFAQGGASDGTEIAEIRVSFPDAEMAAREAALLKDMGVVVRYYDEDGTLSSL